MKVAVLFSGGKDSVFAAFCCLFSGWEPILLTIEPEKHSTMFHHPNVKWCKNQAKAMKLPIVSIKADGKGEEKELLAMKNALKKLKVQGVVSGAIESEYQKQRIGKVAHELGITSFCPVWRTGKALLEEQCKYFETYLVSVAAQGLGKGMLTKRFDADFVEKLGKLKPQVAKNLEGGEGETFVANAPFFKKRLKIKKWKTSFDGSQGAAEISKLT